MLLFEPLDKIIQTYLPDDQIALIKRAFVIARDAHEGQFRSSGEPYITHPVAVAMILAQMHLDHEAVMAALLHDVIEDTPYTEEQLTAEFGKSVAEIVEGVSKLDKLKFRTRQEAQAASFQKMILAMTKDIRVVLIKLADRTHNMRTLGALRPDKRRRIAKETLEIYSPLAHRLGIEQLKNELEDLCFQAIHPQRYAVLQKVIDLARNNHNEMIQPIIDELQQRLDSVGIKARVFGLEKPLYYIYQGMREKLQKFHSIMDIYDFRVIVTDTDSCYRVLGQVHHLYKPRPGLVKDYIAVPKANGYQALHTATIGPKGVPVSVQIRTEEMELMAEMGVTLHWVYREDGKNDSTTAQIKAQRWLQSIIELQQNAGNSFEFIESVKSDLFSDEIYVFTPKGRIVQLPAGATAVDFAYAVHTDVGRTCVGAKVDRVDYPLSQPLQSGQTVEIITRPNAQPNSNWLNFVVTGKARSHIRQTLKHLQGKEALAIGLQQLQTALEPRKLADVDQTALNQLLAELNLTQLDDLLIEIGLGNQLSSVIVCRLFNEPLEIDTANTQSAQPILSVNSAQKRQFANCCHPVLGDPIIAQTNLPNGLVIHHEYCSNVKKQGEKNPRFLPAKWEMGQTKQEFEAEIRVTMRNQTGVLGYLMGAISASKSNIRSIWTEEDNVFFQAILLISVQNLTHLNQVIAHINELHDVVAVERNINQF
ncbi:MAG: bifunctional GTP diphosphokinase/guanosine-3',5'-bis pyrophosphate 3'-pyrophosphohydrolase [Pasteurellaceae bacterium]|nr:bifunctional GTP diphosphokinase/guanosine-3',5'-bis pyrophosphate 3'-pyrophosphohydrolase [Pasteurellaceae bacterium]